MVRKKPGKWFEDENIQRITLKGEKAYIYWRKKYILEKNKKRPTFSSQLGLLSYNAKSAQY